MSAPALYNMQLYSTTRYLCVCLMLLQALCHCYGRQGPHKQSRWLPSRLVNCLPLSCCLPLLQPCHCLPEQQVDAAPKLFRLLSSLNAFTNMYDLLWNDGQHVDDSCELVYLMTNMTKGTMATLRWCLLWCSTWWCTSCLCRLQSTCCWP